MIICKIRSRYLFFRNLIHANFTECNVRINCRICDNIDALIVMTKILSTWSNCSSRDINLMLQKFSNLLIRVNCLLINVRRNYFWRIVKIDYFSEHSLHSRSVAYNIRIDFFIYANINALNNETMILSTRRNRFFRDVIELIFQMIIEIDFEKLFAQNIFQKIHYIHVALNAMYISIIAYA